ncbi:uncharacterized protein BX664DRAFT_389623 [Halteromyces radiatus]|uniref:uncharacterized protein n=1 Tax=Halteromyces radiatus TaxID=101107 RepID=UPI00222085A8|nr:uncharacterized protein BX664DRAFT_389623 [Halteromyces radiatus]KAI8076908.1 hypothetical protein BX664DRAFT_389623 [Halteromyces radiatus]
MLPLNVNLIKKEIVSLFKQEDHYQDFIPCGVSVVSLFDSVFQHISESIQHSETKDDQQQLQQQLDALIELANEKLLMYPYKDVPACWRCLLMDATLLKSFTLISSMEKEETMQAKKHVARELIKILDVALIVSGGPGPRRREFSLKLLDDLQQWLRPRKTNTQGRHLAINSSATLPIIKHAITVLKEPPDYLWFEQHINQKLATPLHLQCGLMNHWPACTTRPWTDIDYILQLAGDRIVPIEIGSKYTDVCWQQKMVRMEDFINDYIIPSNLDNQQDEKKKPIAYLAQHNLFDHIPLLENDISIPDYCYAEPQSNEWYLQRPPPDVIKHCWFGPKGTVSPLHQDPYHNLLAQVVGRKYIRLYSPIHSSALYPYEGIMSNTSQVDIDDPDLESYPRFAEADYVECILKPGEILYIPPKWWHYVQALDTSFSVSFWF